MDQLTLNLSLTVALAIAAPTFATERSAATERSEVGRTKVFVAEPAERNSWDPLSTSLTEEDSRLTKKLRAELNKADLSSRAKKVLIHAEDGRVTLGGLVGSEAEIKAVQHLAEKVAGRSQVTNELFVHAAD